MTAGDEDYVTVSPTMDPYRFIVAVMKYRKGEDDYIQGRVSNPLPENAAKALAESWGAAMGLEVR